MFTFCLYERVVCIYKYMSCALACVYKGREGVPEHSADNCRTFLKGTSDFLSENKYLHTYYPRTLQHRLGLDVPLRNDKLSTECSDGNSPPFGTPLPYLT